LICHPLIIAPIGAQRQALLTERLPSNTLSDWFRTPHRPTNRRANPRVLATSPPAPIRLEEVEAPVSSQPQTAPEIMRSQFARIRALVKYGMKPPQVAEVYGVGVGVIEDILRKA
jgi:hypothetical protein